MRHWNRRPNEAEMIQSEEGSDFWPPLPCLTFPLNFRSGRGDLPICLEFTVRKKRDGGEGRTDRGGGEREREREREKELPLKEISSPWPLFPQTCSLALILGSVGMDTNTVRSFQAPKGKGFE